MKGDASEKTFVAQDSVKESLEKLTIGNRVKITYTEKEGKLFANSVRSIKVKNTDAKAKKDSPNPAKPPAKDSRGRRNEVICCCFHAKTLINLAGIKVLAGLRSKKKKARIFRPRACQPSEGVGPCCSV